MNRPICESASPTEYDVLKTLCENSGLYVEFLYYPLPECKAKKNPNCPSAKAARADTIQVGDNPFRFAGYLLTMRRGGAFHFTKADNITLTMRSTTRRKKLETGTGYYAAGPGHGRQPECLTRTLRRSLAMIPAATASLSPSTPSDSEARQPATE